MNGRNPFSVEEDEIMHLSRESEIKEKPVVKFDAEVQVTNLFFYNAYALLQANLELNNNSSSGTDKLTAEIVSKQEEVL